jgi:hypothetical protein
MKEILMKKKTTLILIVVVAVIAAMTMGLIVREKRRSAQAVEFDFRANALSYLPNEYVTYSITGGPPNAPIYWSTWLADSPRDVNVFRGDYTDGAGAWTSKVLIPSPSGHWIYDAIINGVSERAEFDVADNGTPFVWYCHLGSVQECKRIALEKGSKNVVVGNPLFIDYVAEFKLTAIKQYYTAVKWLKCTGFCTVYDADDDVLRSYHKYQVQVLHEATAPVPLTTEPITLPPCVGAIAADEIVLSDNYGGMMMDGVWMKQQPFGSSALASYQGVMLVRRDYNPQVVTLATGPNSIYPIVVVGGRDMMEVNVFGDYVMGHKNGYHPLISLNPTPNVPSTSPQFLMDPNDLANILNQP